VLLTYWQSRSDSIGGDRKPIRFHQDAASNEFGYPFRRYPATPCSKRLLVLCDSTQTGSDAGWESRRDHLHTPGTSTKQTKADNQVELDALLPAILDKAFKGEL